MHHALHLVLAAATVAVATPIARSSLEEGRTLQRAICRALTSEGTSARSSQIARCAAG
jgi:hypothetical protein